MARKRGHPLLERHIHLMKYLTDARSDAELTQQQAGERIGKDKSFICRLERSRRTPPAPILRALAIAYGIHPDIVLAEAGHQEFRWMDAIRAPDGLPDAILDYATKDEKRELKRYFAFLQHMRKP